MACITQHPLLLGMGSNERDMNTNDAEHFQAKPMEVTHGLPRSGSVAPGMAEPYDGLTAKRKPSNQGHLWVTAVTWANNDCRKCLLLHMPDQCRIVRS